MNTTIKQHKKQQSIIRYFEEAGADYFTWSQYGDMHFGYWDRTVSPLNLQDMLNRMNVELLHTLQLDIDADNLVLDLGCGVGAVSRYMSCIMPQSQFYGFTITPWQIATGRNMNAAAGLSDNITLMEADYCNMPIADNCADAAFAAESVCYALGADKADLVRELYRVLRPGGRFVIADGFRKHSRPLPRMIDKIYRKNMECWALQELADIHLFRAALLEVGFKNIEVRDVSWRVAPSFAHIPCTIAKFFWNRWKKKKKEKLNRQRINNVLAPVYGMLMGLCRPHFGYYIISGEK